MRISQKGWLWLGLGVFAAGALLCILSLAPLLQPQEPAVAADAPAQHRYLVREYEGMVAVFLPRQLFGPKYVTGIRVESLPQADQEALAVGIPVYSDAQLTALLQDYGS